jgi:hypothetical protein
MRHALRATKLISVLALIIMGLIYVANNHAQTQTTPQVSNQHPAQSIMLTGYEGHDKQKAQEFDAKTANQSFKLASPSVRGICVPAGPHKGSSHHQCFAEINDHGTWVICTQPYLSLALVDLHLTSHALRALQPGGSAIVKTMINRYLPTATSSTSAAKLAWGAYKPSADKRYQADKTWYANHLPKGVVSGGNAMYGWAKSHHGPYHASAIAWNKDKVAVGEHNTGHFSLKSRAGKPMAGYLPEVSCRVNTYIESVSKTNKKGVATVKVHSKDDDSAHPCHYVFTHLPSSKKSKTGTPDGSHQQLTGGPVYERVGNSGKFGNEHAKGSFTEECGNSCSTTVPMKGKVTAPGGADSWNTCAVAKVVETGNTVVSTTVQAGSTKSVSFTVPNGDLKHLQWTFRYCKGDHHSTPYNSSKFKINCPPAPAVQLTMSCDCNGVGNLPLVVTKPASDRTYTVWALDGSQQLLSKHTLSAGNNSYTLTGAHSGDTVVIRVHAGSRTWSYTSTVMSVSVS